MLTDDAIPLQGSSNWRSNLAAMDVPAHISTDSTLSTALRMLIEHGRIDEEIGNRMFSHDSLFALTALANMVKQARFGTNVYFNDNLHVNTTNICVLACRFCAFRKGPRHSDAYELSVEEYIHRIEPYSEVINEVHSVGGLHPSWTIEHYEELYRETKSRFPLIHIKSLTAVELKHIAKRSNLSIHESLRRLIAAGLGSLPGGGAEILVDSVRDRICHGKESSQEYLTIHQAAHELGLPTNCTMLFGTVETTAHRIQHMMKLRNQQDISGGFQCFVPYPYLPEFSRLPDAQLASMNEILRVIAISRLMLDNIPHIKAYRMNIGDDVGCLALQCGADDIDGTVGNEEIMHEAGSTTPLDFNAEDLAGLIYQSNSIPVKRNSIYSEFALIAPTIKNDDISLPIAV